MFKQVQTVVGKGRCLGGSQEIEGEGFGDGGCGDGGFGDGGFGDGVAVWVAVHHDPTRSTR